MRSFRKVHIMQPLNVYHVYCASTYFFIADLRGGGGIAGVPLTALGPGVADGAFTGRIGVPPSCCGAFAAGVLGRFTTTGVSAFRAGVVTVSTKVLSNYIYRTNK